MKLSIGVPTYNGEAYIRQALQSILDQSFTDYELIVCDDCSIDHTREMVEAFHDPRLRLVTNPQRLGLVGNWNRCLALSSGQYVQIFHQDDVMQPGMLQREVQALDRCPTAGYAFTNMALIDDKGCVIGGHWTPILPATDTTYPGIDFFSLLLREGNLVPCSSVMLRASCIEHHGAFDARLGYTPDLEMWLRQALHGDVAYVAGPLLQLRKHAGQESRHFIDSSKPVLEVQRAFQIIFNEQRKYIPRPKVMYASAITHLQRWSMMFLKGACRKGDVKAVISFTRLYLQYAVAHKMGEV